MLTPTKIHPLKDAMTVTDFNGSEKGTKDAASKDEDIDHTFATGTSLHGVGLIANAERILVKVIWTVILLTLCGVLVWQIVVLFIDYYKYTPVTEVRIEVKPVLVAFNSLEFFVVNPVLSNLAILCRLGYNNKI